MRTPPGVRETPIPGGWTERDVVIGERAFQLVTPAEPDELLNHLDSELARDADADPYWAALWATAPVMANLIPRAEWPEGTRAIELGCGVGLVGLAALACGLDVVFSDCVPTAVAAARENAHRNGFSKADAMILDWRSPPRLKFPFVLASDVLYERNLHESLLNTLDRLLEANGSCWIGDPNRSVSREFIDLAVERGFDVDIRDRHFETQSVHALGEFQLLVVRRA